MNGTVDEQKTTLKHLARQRREVLAPLYKLLSGLHSRCSEEVQGGKVRHYWDWDMVRSYIDHDSPREIFGNAAAAYLSVPECPRVVLPPGTRREMREYLTRKAQAYRKRRLTGGPFPQEGHATPTLSGGGAEWERIGEDLDLLGDYETVRRLRRFLEVSVDLKESASASERVDALARSEDYREALQQLTHREGGRRNKADALNVSQVKNFGKGNPNHGVLVTGTHDLLVGFPDVALDPLSSLADVSLSAKISDPKTRLSTLRRWVGKVGQLIDSCETVEEAADGATAPITRQRARKLKAALASVEGEGVLREIGTTLRRVAIATQDRADRLPLISQSKLRTIQGAPKGSLRVLEASISELLDGVLYDENTALGVLGLSWQRLEGENEGDRGVVKARLYREETGETVLTTEEKAGRYSIYWEASVTLVAFMRLVEAAINRRWVPLPDHVHAEILYDTYRVREIAAKAEYKSWSFSLDAIPRSAERLRVLTEHGTCFYSMGDVGANAPVVAVIGRDKSFRWLLALFQETSLDYVPRETLKRELQNNLTL